MSLLYPRSQPSPRRKEEREQTTRWKEQKSGRKNKGRKRLDLRKARQNIGNIKKHNMKKGENDRLKAILTDPELKSLQARSFITLGSPNLCPNKSVVNRVPLNSSQHPTFWQLSISMGKTSTHGSGWWYTYPSEKYEFVSWDYDIPNLRKAITRSPSYSHSWFIAD
jgi:hypothetical protein